MEILVNGAAGRMGGTFIEYCEKNGISPVGKCDILTERLSTFCKKADVLVDFSEKAAAKEITDFIAAKKMPAVLAATGYGDNEISLIKKAAETVPVFLSANLSLGAAFLLLSVKHAAKFFNDADIEITETHHSRKKDSPSGTALLCFDFIKSVRPDATCRPEPDGCRKKNEVGIHSLRLGDICGTHEVIFATPSQTVTLRHSVNSRTAYAEGALAAAKFIIGKKSGLYGIEDLFGGDFGEI